MSNCALVTVKQVNAKEGLYKNEIDKKLKEPGKTRQPVPADGYCIIHSWLKALANNSGNNSMPQGYKHLLRMACSDIKDNLEFYSPFINSQNVDPIKELERYEKDSDNSGDIVDLIVYALANVTSTTAHVLATDDGKSFTTYTVTPTSSGIVSKWTIHLCKIKSHYEAALNI